MGIILAHGGAGYYTNERIRKKNDILDNIIDKASQMVEDGNSCLDVAEFVVNRLEDNESFNPCVVGVPEQQLFLNERSLPTERSRLG